MTRNSSKRNSSLSLKGQENASEDDENNSEGDDDGDFEPRTQDKKGKNGGRGRQGKAFTDKELHILRQLIQAKAQFICNKKADPESIIEKGKAWKWVEVEFNKQPGFNKRTVKQLKKKWQNNNTRDVEGLEENKESRKKRKHTSGQHSDDGDGYYEAPIEFGDDDDEVSERELKFIEINPESNDDKGMKEILANLTEESVPIIMDIGTDDDLKERLSNKGKNESQPNLSLNSSLSKRRQEMEEEEHKMRMKILRTQSKIEEEKLQQIKDQTEQKRIEHEIRLKVFYSEIKKNLAGSSTGSVGMPNT